MKKQMWIGISIFIFLIGASSGLSLVFNSQKEPEKVKNLTELSGASFSASGEKSWASKMVSEKWEALLSPEEAFAILDKANKEGKLKIKEEVRFLDLFDQAYKEEEQKFLKYIASLPECKSPEINPNIQIHKLEDHFINCKKRPAEWRMVDGLGGIEPRYTAINGKLAGEYYDSRNPHLALCKYEDNHQNYPIFAEDSNWPSEFLRDAPAEKRAVELIEKGLISSVNLRNIQIGPVKLWGGKDFPAETPHAYAENGKHYYLIAGRTVGENWESVVVIDDQLYSLWKREYGKPDTWWIKTSERVLEGFSGESLIFHRMVDGKLKPGLDPNDYFDYWLKNPITDYTIESCEFPLAENQTFVSYLGENQRDKKLSVETQEKQTPRAENPLPCEKPNYYQNLKGEKRHFLYFDKKTNTYRGYIPELCAIISTAPHYLAFSRYGSGKAVQEKFPLLRKENKLYNPEFFNYEKFPILIFENKGRKQWLLDAVNKQAKKSHQDCRLISYENEHYLHWAKDQAQIYRYFAPAKRLGYETENFCINKATVLSDWRNGFDKEYYVLFDARYPWVFSYAFDQWGNKQLGNNLTVFFQ